MRIWVEGPTPYTKKGEFLYDALRKNLKVIARQGTDTELHWPKSGYTDPTYVWTRSYNAIEGVKSVYEAWKKEGRLKTPVTEISPTISLIPVSAASRPRSLRTRR